MKSTGLVRRLDPVGRLVLPSELREQLEIVEGTPLEVFVDGSCVLLKLYQPNCIFCNETSNVTMYKGKRVCPDCLDNIKHI